MSNSQDVKLSSNYIVVHHDDLHDDGVPGQARTMSTADITKYNLQCNISRGLIFFIPENVVAIIIFDYENDPVIKEDPPGTK